MTVATAIQPDYNTQTGTAYPLAIDAAFAVVKTIGDQFSCHEQSTPNMTIRVEAGSIYVDGSLVSVSAQNSSSITAPSVNQRYDIAAINPKTGAVAIYTGTEAISPVDPTIPKGFLPVARISMQTSTTAITNSIVTDLRSYWLRNVSGITPEANPSSQMMGNLAYADTIDPGDLRGATASRLLAIGSDNRGRLLALNGASMSDSDFTVTPQSGRWVQISSYTPSGVASQWITGFNAALYDQYQIIVKRLRPSGDGRGLRLRTSSDGGSSADSGASDYVYSVAGYTNNEGSDAEASNAAAYINLSAGRLIGNASGPPVEDCSAIITLLDPGDAAAARIAWDIDLMTSGGNYGALRGVGRRVAAADVDGVLLYFSADNIASGGITLLGRYK